VNKYKDEGKFRVVRVVWVPECITRITKLISGNDNHYPNLGSGTSGSGNSGSGSCNSGSGSCNSGTGNGYRVFCRGLPAAPLSAPASFATVSSLIIDSTDKKIRS
jgi:hypothetical protein